MTSNLKQHTHKSYFWKFIYVFLFTSLLCFSSFSNSFGNIYTVTNLNDTGQGSLRSCLTIANSVSGIDTIRFNVVGIIRPQAEYMVTEGVFIDGTSAPNYISTPTVTISSYNGTIIKAQNLSNLTIKGLKLTSFSSFASAKNGIELLNCNDVIISENVIRDRKNAIFADNTTDIQITNNDLRNCGLEFYSNLVAAIYLNKVTANRLQGGVYISNNTFGILGNPTREPIRLLYLENATNITLANFGGNINITSGTTVENPIYLKNIENLEVKSLNLSAITVPASRDDSRSSGINITDSKNIRLHNLIIRNRHNGISAGNCSDIRIENNDLRDSGFDFGHLAIDGAAINLRNIQSQSILGGLYIKGNRYGEYMHKPTNIFRITETNNLKIDTSPTSNTNIIIDRGGLDVTSPFVFNQVNHLHISNIDASFNHNGVFEGIAFDIENSNYIKLYRTAARQRLASLIGRNITDIEILENDFRDSGVGFFIGGASIILRGLHSNNLRGGIFMKGNNFGSYRLAPSSTILWIDEATDISISNDKRDNPNILMDNSGLDVKHPFIFNAIQNLKIQKVDLSSSYAEGVAMSIRNSANVLIEGTTAMGRNIAVNADYITDISIIENDFRDSGFMTNDNGVFPAINLFNLNANNLLGGVFIRGNTFGKIVLHPQRILQIVAASDIFIVGEQNASRENIILNESGLNLDYPIALGFIERLSVRALNFEADNRQNSSALQIRRSENISLSNMQFVNWEKGIELEESGQTKISCNNFFENGVGVSLVDTRALLTENNFVSNIHAIDATRGEAEVRYNYWGAADGSSSIGGSGDAFIGDVEGENFSQELSKCAYETENISSLTKSLEAVTSSKKVVSSHLENQRNEWKVFPNPTYSKATIKIDSKTNLEAVKVRIVDVTGREFYQRKYSNVDSHSSILIDLSNYKSGVYFIKLITDVETQVLKIIKE